MKLRYLLPVLLVFNFLYSQTNLYHDTQGKLEISNSGQATYTLPIALPPSIQSVGPVINLVYSSGQMGGIAGQGWNINSISAITRMATRKDIDGFIDGVDFDSNDKLALDGQRLLLVQGTGNYWSDGSVYQTEVQSNTKIQLIGSGTNIYFIVTTPDGSVNYYGNYGGVNATDSTAYYIVKFIDTKSNFINYYYSPPDFGSIYINRIEFSANEISNPVPSNRIVFNYNDALRTESFYIKGINVQKRKILDNIQVFTDQDKLFRTYQITHTSDPQLGYEQVSQIQEFNGAGEKANPVIFNYATTTNDVTENTVPYTDGLNLTSSPDLSGDFDGDGRLDFISGNQMFLKLFQGGSGTPPVYMPFSTPNFAVTTLFNNKLNQSQSLLKINKLNNTTSEFKVYGLVNNAIQNFYTKTVNLDYTAQSNVVNTTGTVLGIQCLNYIYSNINNFGTTPIAPTFKEGDFDGNGISEILISKHSTYYTITNGYVYDPNNLPFDPSHCNITISSTQINNYYLLDLNPNTGTTLNSTGYIEISDAYNCLGNIKQIADFNSDGKSDILSIDTNGAYRLCEIVLSATGFSGHTSLIGQGLIPNYTVDKQLLFGDFNGDGKTDIMMPDASGNGCPTCNLWHIYFSNPLVNSTGEYFVKKSFNITGYFPNSGNYYGDQWHNSTYYAMDINKDGKSDFVRIWTRLFQPDPGVDPQNIDSSWQVRTFINNIDFNNGFTPNPVDNSTSGLHEDDDNSRPIPLVSSYKYNQGLDSDLLIIRYHGNNSFPRTTTFVDFKKNVAQDNLLTQVIQSGGQISDKITYKSMEPEPSYNGLGALSDFYSSSNQLLYPFIEFRQMPTSFLVSKLTNTSMGVTKNQDFKYNGLSIQLNGIGAIGFKKTARSSWYRDDSDKRVWNATENDPLQRGSNIRTYSMLMDASTPFTFLTNYTSGLLSKTENTFNQNTDSITKLYSILLHSQVTTDYLSNVISEKIYNSYTTDYLLPKSITTNSYFGTVLQGTVTSETAYDSDTSGTGNHYYIGRPSEVSTTKTIFVNTLNGSPDTKTSYEKYVYTDGNVTSVEKRENNSSEILVDSYTYLPNGLLDTKTINATGTNSVNQVSPRTITYGYDSTNRFVTKLQDPEGLVTLTEYDNLYGVVLSQKSVALNRITTSKYDKWGKRTSVIDFLGKQIDYTYTKDNGVYRTTETSQDGSKGIVDSNALGRVIKKGTTDINGIFNFSTKEYDYLGRVVKESEPFVDGSSPSLFTTYEYDDYGRLSKTVSFNGKITTLKYSQLTVEANDQIFIKKTTKDANGLIQTVEDLPGGVIKFYYDASGNQVKSSYEGIEIQTFYNDWGKKIKLVDPSAGTYEYAYNAYGEIIEEKTPKGVTNYSLNEFGKLKSKKIVGNTTSERTDILSDYIYNDTTKLLTDIKVANAYDDVSSYHYDFDPTYFQLTGTTERLPKVTFTKTITLDDFGRPDQENYKAEFLENGKTSDKTIINTYKNGKHFQLIDKETDIVLTQVDGVDERENLIKARYGNGITIKNTYDIYGYPTIISHDGTNGNVMKLENQFEPVRGNLKRRYNSMFNYEEKFDYDELDRLTNTFSTGETLVNATFENSVEGFQYTGNSDGYVLFNTGKLKVKFTDALAFTKKQIYHNVAIGKILHIKADVEKMGGLANATFVVSERDSSTDDVIHEEVLGDVNSGSFVYDYTTVACDSNVFIYAKAPDANPLQANTSTTSLLPIGGTSPLTNTVIFTLDNLIVNSYVVETQNYDNRGRIENNSTIGNYKYGDADHPYQVTDVNEIFNPANSYFQENHDIKVDYTAFKSPVRIENADREIIDFDYNYAEERSAMYYGGNQQEPLERPYRKYYSADGSMEIKYDVNHHATEFITYIGGTAYTAPLVYKKDDGENDNYFYLHRDQQGSILAITNDHGNVVEKRHFDAWGTVLGVTDGSGHDIGKLTFFDRGYTGHEHLQGVGLINMNARLYDPHIHRFLQPDAFIEQPNNTQNYNRYGYCVNNPLKYTDITGNVFGLDDAVIIGAAMALASYLVCGIVNGTPITLQGAINSTFMGAISGFITFGVGSCAGTIANFYVRASFQAIAHGYFEGVISGIQGGGFWSGLASGALSSVASSAWEGGSSFRHFGSVNENVPTSVHKGLSGALGLSKSFGTLAFGTVMGGAGASLTGGNFWKGAVTGLIVSGLNHLAHMGYDLDEEPKPKNSFFTDKLNGFIRGLDISTSTKEFILSLGGKEAESLAPAFFKSSLKILGGAAGLYSIASVGSEYLQNPTTANLLKLTVTTGVVIAGLATGGMFSGALSFGMSIFNDTETATSIYNYLGNQIDKVAGYSVGKSFYGTMNNVLHEVNYQLKY